MKEKIWIKDRYIIYELVRKKVRNINLRIKPDLTIIISANPRVSKKQIEDFLISKAEWIDAKLNRIENLEKIQYDGINLVDGENIRILGYNLILRLVSSKIIKIEMDNTYLYINTPDICNMNVIKSTWKKWYESFIKVNFIQIIKELYPIFSQYNIEMPKLKFRYMKTRWGTCNARTGTITLNKFLIQVPIECIEYVVAHEFTHFIHQNHSRDFYNSLSVIMPDYKQREKLLEKYLIVN